MEYKRLIIEMIEKISETDTIFLRQIYTLVKRHVEKGQYLDRGQKVIQI